MSEETKAKREVEIHFIPNDYDGRCNGTENFSTKLSKGGRLPEGEVMHKYEILLPIPTSDEDAQEFYDLALQDLVSMGVAKLATSIDDKVKPTLFAPEVLDKEGEIITEGAFDGEGNVKASFHLAAQAVADSWRYRARVARGKSVEIQELIRVLVASGKLDEEEADGITTKAELMAALM